MQLDDDNNLLVLKGGPTNQPEEIGIDGVIAKSLEILLFVGILFILRQEKRQIRKILIQLAK
jgi:hypothetical protein